VTRQLACCSKCLHPLPPGRRSWRPWWVKPKSPARWYELRTHGGLGLRGHVGTAHHQGARKGRWLAWAHLDGSRCLGEFATLREAQAAVEQYVREHTGERTEARP
jgi:hypothetical protein